MREREEVTEKLKVTLKKSLIGRIPKHRRTVKALGLRKINQVVWHDDNPVIRGMIKEVEYLLEVERASLNIEEDPSLSRSSSEGEAKSTTPTD